MPLLKNKAVLFGLLVLGLLITGMPCRAGLKVGDAFPDLATQGLEGTLPESYKGKIVLVDFWASWCAPCALSFPVMESLQQRYKERLIIIAVSVDDKPAKMQAFLKKHPASFVVVRDAAHKLVAAADAQAMPTSFLLDGSGKVRFIHTGFHAEETQQQYLTEIEALLKATP